MRKHRLTGLLAVAALAVPASAQDWNTGVMDPAAMSSSMSIQAAAEAQAQSLAGKRRQARTAGNGSDASRVCSEDLPEYRRALGSDHDKVRRLTAMCRQLGDAR